MLRSGLQVGNSTLLIRRQPAHAKNPSYGSCHASDNVLAEASRQQCVIAIMTNCKQFLRRRGSLLGEVQRRNIAFFKMPRIILLRARPLGLGKQRVAVFGVCSQARARKIFGSSNRVQKISPKLWI